VTVPTSPSGEKRRLRAEMRAVRRSVTDPERRSVLIWEFLDAMPAVRDATVVMVFTPIRGEPDPTGFIEGCRARGTTVLVPEDDPDAASIDVVVVPGLAFTARGDRLGQGGGWYDRFLARIRPTTVTVGVGFREQLVGSLPIEPHDIVLDHVVTDAGPAGAPNE
jgi:5-formyltetrahydrofolate cyclo-ligase